MSESRDNAAVAILADEIIRFREEGGGHWDFEEDHAIEALLRHGLRPSSLSADLEYLIATAQRRIAQGKHGSDR